MLAPLSRASSIDWAPAPVSSWTWPLTSFTAPEISCSVSVAWLPTGTPAAFACVCRSEVSAEVMRSTSCWTAEAWPPTNSSPPLTVVGASVSGSSSALSTVPDHDVLDRGRRVVEARRLVGERERRGPAGLGERGRRGERAAAGDLADRAGLTGTV